MESFRRCALEAPLDAPCGPCRHQAPRPPPSTCLHACAPPARCCVQASRCRARCRWTRSSGSCSQRSRASRRSPSTGHDDDRALEAGRGRGPPRLASCSGAGGGCSVCPTSVPHAVCLCARVAQAITRHTQSSFVLLRCAFGPQGIKAVGTLPRGRAVCLRGQCTLLWRRWLGGHSAIQYVWVCGVV